MINFDTELDQAGVARLVRETIPPVTDTITITPQRETRTTHVQRPSAQWTWEDLRNYVVGQLEAHFGAFPRDPLKEKAIFVGFLNRWGIQAGPIAEFVFELCDGMWKGAPMSVYRFCKNSDPYFAQPIAARLS